MVFLDTLEISKKYKNLDCLWGLEPNKYITKIPKIISPGKVLDIGVGEGRNALFLAKNGFNVTGVDISKEAIDKFLNFAKKDNLKVNGLIQDIVNFKFDNKYKAIICVATIHLIQKDKIIELINKIKNQTEKDGINLITAFTKEDEGYQIFKNLYFFDKNELKELYNDWQILEYENYTKEETHDKPHKHYICVIIAKKRSN